MQKELNLLKNKFSCLFMINLRLGTQKFLLLLKKQLNDYIDDYQKNIKDHIKNNPVLDILKWFLETIAREIQILSLKDQKDVHAVLYHGFFLSLPQPVSIQISEWMAGDTLFQRRIPLNQSRYKECFNCGKNLNITCTQYLSITTHPKKLWCM